MKPVVNLYNKQRKLTVTPALKTLVEECVAASLLCEEFSEPAAVDVTFVSNRKIRDYNKQYRNVDRETDVLSFPLGEEEFYTDPDSGDVLLGDIVISLEKAAEQAREYGHSYEREVGFLTVHSMLHLLGYDHIDEAEGDEMRAHEKVILKKLGLKR